MTHTFKLFILVLILLSPARHAVAQHIWYEIFAGPAVSYVSKERDALSHSHKWVPHAGITAFIPFNDRIALKTGAIYQMKGISSSGTGYNKDSAMFRYGLDTRTTFHFLNIPLQLAVNIGKNKQGFWRVAGGMSYGFLVGAKKHLNMQTYKGEDLLRARAISFKPVRGSERSGSYPGLPNHEGTPLHVFTPAVRLDVTYHWQERLLISAFYEYNLQDVRVHKAGNSSLKLHYTGLSFGVLFW